MLRNGPNYSSIMFTTFLAPHFIVRYLIYYRFTMPLNLYFWLWAEAMRMYCDLHSNLKSLCRLCNLCSALFYTICSVFIADFLVKILGMHISLNIIKYAVISMLQWEEFTTYAGTDTCMYINMFLHILDAETSYWFNRVNFLPDSWYRALFWI